MDGRRRTLKPRPTTGEASFSSLRFDLGLQIRALRFGNERQSAFGKTFSPFLHADLDAWFSTLLEIRWSLLHGEWYIILFLFSSHISLYLLLFFSFSSQNNAKKNVRITITGCSPSHADYTTRRIVHVNYSKERYIVLLVTLWFQSLRGFGIEKRLLSLSSLAVCLEYQQGRATRMISGKFHSHFQKGIGRKM